MEYIDATPTWRGLMPLLIERAAAGDAGCKSELLRLATMGDRIIASDKAAKAEGEKMVVENAELDPNTARLVGRCWADVLSRLTDSGYQPAGRDRAMADAEFKAAIVRYLAHWEPVERTGEEKREQE